MSRLYGDWCGAGNGFTGVEFKCPACDKYVSFTVEEIFEGAVERTCSCGQGIRAYALDQPTAVTLPRGVFE